MGDNRIGPTLKGTGRGMHTQKVQKHDKAYWDRLRRQFEACDYPHAGAYQSEAAMSRSQNLHDFRRMIEARETPMKITRRIKEHWTNVAELGCIITGHPAEIAHCHGASISEELGPKFRPGMAQRQNHWLVLPLNPELHRAPGIGLDSSDPKVWEQRYGCQVELLEELSWKLGYCVFEKAGIDHEHRAYDCPSAQEP